jgi:hypothetical protein
MNGGLSKILAPSPRELPAKRGEGELTFGSPAAFAAGSVWRGNRAKQSNTPSVSRQKQAADTSLGEGGDKGKVKSQIAVYLFSHPKEIGV